MKSVRDAKRELRKSLHEYWRYHIIAQKYFGKQSVAFASSFLEPFTDRVVKNIKNYNEALGRRYRNGELHCYEIDIRTFFTGKRPRQYSIVVNGKLETYVEDGFELSTDYFIVYDFKPIFHKICPILNEISGDEIYNYKYSQGSEELKFLKNTPNSKRGKYVEKFQTILKVVST